MTGNPPTFTMGTVPTTSDPTTSDSPVGPLPHGSGHGSVVSPPPPESDDWLAAATVYERCFVPWIFEAWANELTARLDPGPCVTALDVACGTGVLARSLWDRVRPTGSVTAVDLSASMLEVARTVSPGVDFRQGDADALDFPDESFDIVGSQFGLMFFPDPQRALSEMWRVLRPGGRLAVSVWGSIDQAPAYGALAALLTETVGPDAGAMIESYFSMGSPGDFEALIEASGLPLSLSDRTSIVRVPDADDFVLVELRGWPPLAALVDPDDEQRIREAAPQRLAPWVGANEQLTTPITARIALGIKS